MVRVTVPPGKKPHNYVGDMIPSGTICPMIPVARFASISPNHVDTGLQNWRLSLRVFFRASQTGKEPAHGEKPAAREAN